TLVIDAAAADAQVLEIGQFCEGRYPAGMKLARCVVEQQVGELRQLASRDEVLIAEQLSLDQNPGGFAALDRGHLVGEAWLGRLLFCCDFGERRGGPRQLAAAACRDGERGSEQKSVKLNEFVHHRVSP